jgi:prefoldin subunit 1
MLRCRFVLTARPAVVSRLEREDKEVKEEIGALEKKLHYHETTHKNTREHIEAMLKSAGG